MAERKCPRKKSAKISILPGGKVMIGIIGGTGLYILDDLENVREVEVSTPFGAPSDVITIGTYAGHEIAFLPRHGRGHRLLPTEVPCRANIWALKSLGVTRIFSASAVGSMRTEITLTTPVIVDQMIDRTIHRVSTFFGEGLVAHVSMADPFCSSMRKLLIETADRIGMPIVEGGTYICIEGPQFSSRAESHWYRDIGAAGGHDYVRVAVIGMTNATEAKLAREAEICYVTIALPTDYDCWHEEEDDVSCASVVERLAAGAAKAKKLILGAVEHLDHADDCGCGDSLRHAFLTERSRIPQATLDRLEPIVGRYFVKS